MINNLSITSPHLTTSSYSMPYISNNGQSAGTVRWNTSGQQMEVFDGSIWITISQNDKPIYLVVEKLEEFDHFMRFLELNPDVKERYEVHKTYEILNNDS